MTSLEASTTCLFHADADLRDSSSRRMLPVQAFPSEPLSLSSAQAKFGSKSLDAYTPNYGGLLFKQAAPYADFMHATAECWAYFRSHRTDTGGNTSLVASIHTNTRGYYLGVMVDSAGRPRVVSQSSPSATASASLPLSQWVHLAATTDRFLNRRLYVDGAMVAFVPPSSGGPPEFTNDFCIGGRGDSGSLPPDGFIDEARYVFGQPIYEAPFALPLTPRADGTAGDSLLLHGEGSEGGTTIVDSSPNGLTLTQSGSSGSVTTSTALARVGTRALQFGGTQSLAHGASSLFNFGAATNATISCWVFLQSGTGSDPHFFEFGTDINNRFSVFFNVATASVMMYAMAGGTGSVVMTAKEDIRGRWVHMEVSREGGLWTIFIDGEPRAHTVSANIPSGNLQLSIGRHFLDANASAFYMRGAIDEFSVVMGTTLHRMGFTPPASAYSDSPAAAPIALSGPLRRLGSPAPSVAPQFLDGTAKVRDLYHGGRGRITATVKEKSSPANLPLRRKVWLMRERDAQVVRETWSDAITGSYTFDNIDEAQTYSVLAFDHLRNYRAVIADNLTPEVI